MKIQGEKSPVIRETLSDQLVKPRRRSLSVMRSTTSGTTSRKHSRKWIKSMAFKSKIRLDRYKNRSKKTKDKSSSPA